MSLHRAHPFFPQFTALMREIAAHPPVYDLGTSRRFAKEMGLVRELFDEKTYRAGGFNPDLSIGSDRCDFHCDLHDLAGIDDCVAGSVVCFEVLEHLRYPDRAVRALHRVLRPGGVCVASVPFLASYHGKRRMEENPLYDSAQRLSMDDSHSGYGDYWRFTHEGLAALFAQAGFGRVDVWPIDGRVLGRLCLLGMYPLLTRWPFLLRLVGKFDRPMLGRATTLHFVRAIK